MSHAPTNQRRSLAERLGLVRRPRPDEWVELARFPIDDPVTGRSEAASALDAALRSAGIDSELRPMVLLDNYVAAPGLVIGGSSPSAASRIRVVVRVRQGQLGDARDVFGQIDRPRV